MAFPRLSPSMLLASLILLLYWTTSSARSHDPPSSAVVSPSHRVKRDLDFETREKVDKMFTVVTSGLTVSIEGLASVMKSLSNIASLAPGIGGLVVSFVNAVLIFIPQDDPVLTRIAEVNRKLDSISIQISDLATDVEWFNYASVYSQDEVRILNSWKKFSELLQNSQLVQSEEDKLRLAEIFVNYYENTVTEASVANFFHYLTVKDTSLSGNLNDLLRRKFKCDVKQIGKYNLYFSRLLWQGMVLNQFYWKLIGLNSSRIETKHTQMFQDVSTAQISALNYCLDNHMKYVEEDVVKISKGLSADDQRAIALKVKEFLDKKYFWYNWVVLVYNTDTDTSHVLYKMKKIPVGTITVAVGYTLKAEEINKEQVKNNIDKCYNKYIRVWVGDEHYNEKTTCDTMKNEISECSHEVDGRPLREFVKVMYASRNDGVREPEVLSTTYDPCMVGIWGYRLNIYYSRNTPACHNNPCQNGGNCKPLLDTDGYLCECPLSHHGDECQKEFENNNVPAIDKVLTLPDITTINAKLEKILDYIRGGH